MLKWEEDLKRQELEWEAEKCWDEIGGRPSPYGIRQHRARTARAYGEIRLEYPPGWSSGWLRKGWLRKCSGRLENLSKESLKRDKDLVRESLKRDSQELQEDLQEDGARLQYKSSKKTVHGYSQDVHGLDAVSEETTEYLEWCRSGGRCT